MYRFPTYHLSLIQCVWHLFAYSRQGEYIVLDKSESAEGFYNDGLTFVFANASGLQDIRPKHIHFELMTEGGDDDDFESCDLRLYSVEPAKTDETEDEKSAESQSSLR